MFAQISDHRGKEPIWDTWDMSVITEKNAIYEMVTQGAVHGMVS